jgi:hypothetical protein
VLIAEIVRNAHYCEPILNMATVVCLNSMLISVKEVVPDPSQRVKDGGCISASNRIAIEYQPMGIAIGQLKWRVIDQASCGLVGLNFIIKWFSKRLPDLIPIYANLHSGFGKAIALSTKCPFETRKGGKKLRGLTKHFHGEHINDVVPRCLAHFPTSVSYMNKDCCKILLAFGAWWRSSQFRASFGFAGALAVF